MEMFVFDLQRFSIMPTLLNGEDGGGVRYWNTIVGAEVSGFGNTFFVNHGANCVIYCDGDNTKVYNDTVAPNVVINGAGGRDWLINDAVNVTINGNAGKDDLLNYGNKVELYGGKDDDALQNRGGSKVTIDGGANNDWIYNDGATVSIDGGTGSDNIENRGNNVTVNAGKNNDHVYNFGKKVTINAGAGDDHVGNTNSSVTIKAGTGKDSIYNDSGSVKICATDDDSGDYFYNEGSKVTITAGAGNDSIDSRYSNTEHKGSAVRLDAGDGNNQISLDGGNNISVKAGSGDDTVTASISSGKFHDVTLDAGDGKNIVNVTGGWSFVTVNGGDDAQGVDAVFNEADNAFIEVNAGNDYIRNEGNYSVLFGGEDGDVIENYGKNVFIHGDDDTGKNTRKIGDFIHSDKGNDVTIEAGTNDDTIEAYHDVRASINGGAGRDYIFLQRLAASDIKSLFSESAHFVADIWNIYLGIKGAPFTASLELKDWLGALTSSKDTSVLSPGSQKAIGFATVLLSAVSAWQN